MIKQSTIAAVGIAVAVQLTVCIPVQADNTGAFIGGVMAARVGRNMRERTEAEQQQAAAAQQQAYNSQQSKSWFTDDLFRSMMRIRGMESNSPSSFAEAFYSRKCKL